MQAEAWNFKKRTITQVFSCEFYKFFKSSFFTEHLRTAASENCSQWTNIYSKSTTTTTSEYYSCALLVCLLLTWNKLSQKFHIIKHLRLSFWHGWKPLNIFARYKYIFFAKNVWRGLEYSSQGRIFVQDRVVVLFDMPILRIRATIWRAIFFKKTSSS